MASEMQNSSTLPLVASPRRAELYGVPQQSVAAQKRIDSKPEMTPLIAKIQGMTSIKACEAAGDIR
jgi:hypothetical protein